MGSLLQVKNLSYTQQTKSLFVGLNLSINSNSRIGLVGHNGCGKSTLLALINKQLEPDAGEVIHPKGLQIGNVEQFVPDHIRQLTMEQAVAAVLPEDCRELELYRVHCLLPELGFHVEQYDIPVAQLSGGQQNLVLLARAMLLEPELLLMDEPGNHMDVKAMSCLTNYLLNQKGLAFLMISHDRNLLNTCCNQTVFLRDLRSYEFDLPFSQAKEALREHDEVSAARRELEEKEIARVRASAKRLAQWGKTFDNPKMSRKAKSMEKRADKLDDQKTQVTRGSGLSLNLQSQGLSTKTVLTLEDMQVNLPNTDQLLVSCEHLVLKPGDRVALLGENGTGKSTSINRMIEAFESNTDSSIRFNPNVDLLYYDQELEQFNKPLSRSEWLRVRCDANDEDIKKVLIGAGVAYQDFDQAVNSLSGGEKARMMFMLIRLKQPNLLILDEPTNHIDLEGREQLEQRLLDSRATLLMTSHDRFFLETVANRFWVIRQNQLIEIYSLDEFYDQLSDSKLNKHSTTSSNTGSVTTGPNTEEAMLIRIDELEKLLSTDKSLKPKYQKLEKQKRWQQELDALWLKLESE